MRRRSPRAVLLWSGAVVIALVTALIVATDLAALHKRAQGLGPPRPVVAAVRDLPVGTTIGDGDVRTRSVHRSQLPAGAVPPSDARGRVVSVAVVKGAFVVSGNLAPRHRTGLNGAVPTGMRAVRIVARDALRPPVGSAVDVLATFDAANSEPRGAAPTVVAARGVLVLGTDDAAATVQSSGAGRGGAGLGMTLLVPEDDAPRLAYATATGVVTIALVPPEDARPMAAR